MTKSFPYKHERFIFAATYFLEMFSIKNGKYAHARCVAQRSLGVPFLKRIFILLNVNACGVL